MTNTNRSSINKEYNVTGGGGGGLLEARKHALGCLEVPSPMEVVRTGSSAGTCNTKLYLLLISVDKDLV